MQTFSEISKIGKPDKKIRDMVGQTIGIVSIDSVEKDYKGQKTTFNNITLDDGTRVSVNSTIAKQINEHLTELPFTAKVSQKRSKLGLYCYLE